MADDPTREREFEAQAWETRQRLLSDLEKIEQIVADMREAVIDGDPEMQRKAEGK